MPFGKDFIWGSATSAYQVEGAAHESDKGDCIWDISSASGNCIFEGQIGDTACDHYHRYAEDVALMAKLKIPYYRALSDLISLGTAGSAFSKGRIS